MHYIMIAGLCMIVLWVLAFGVPTLLYISAIVFGLIYCSIEWVVVSIANIYKNMFTGTSEGLIDFTKERKEARAKKAAERAAKQEARK